MVSRAIIVQGNKVLMVNQYVERGDIVWTFPGGKIEESETPEQACIREVKEETGYDVKIKRLLFESLNKYIYLAEITGGKLYIDVDNADNADIIDVEWVCLEDTEKFDSYTLPLLKIIKERNEQHTQ